MRMALGGMFPAELSKELEGMGLYAASRPGSCANAHGGRAYLGRCANSHHDRFYRMKCNLYAMGEFPLVHKNRSFGESSL